MKWVYMGQVFGYFGALLGVPGLCKDVQRCAKMCKDVQSGLPRYAWREWNMDEMGSGSVYSRRNMILITKVLGKICLFWRYFLLMLRSVGVYGLG